MNPPFLDSICPGSCTSWLSIVHACRTQALRMLHRRRTRRTTLAWALRAFTVASSLRRLVDGICTLGSRRCAISCSISSSLRLSPSFHVSRRCIFKSLLPHRACRVAFRVKVSFSPCSIALTLSGRNLTIERVAPYIYCHLLFTFVLSCSILTNALSGRSWVVPALAQPLTT